MAEQSILTDSLIPSNSQNDINVPFLYNDTPFDWTPRNPFLEESDSGSGSGPFCKVYQDTEEKKWMLLGGTVTAGNGTETIASIEIGDVSEIEEAGGEPPLPPHPDGTFFWLAVAAKANVEDDVLLPGCNLQGVLIEDGRAVRDNRAPTVAEPSGRLYISLGEWMNGRFNPAGCGNIQISHCPGTLSYSRG
jgi:hypothetical protein